MDTTKVESNNLNNNSELNIDKDKSNYNFLLSYNLKLLRKEKNLTQEELANKANISFRTYQQIESGDSNPTLNTVDSLAEALGISFGCLLKLSKIRTNLSQKNFIDIIKNNFDDYPVQLGIRTFDGNSHWANQLVRTKFPNVLKWPVNVSEFYKDKPEIQDLLRAQYLTEKKGIALHYTLKNPASSQADVLFSRVAPILIYLNKDELPTMSLVFASLVDNTFDKKFNLFSTKLLNCLEQK